MITIQVIWISTTLMQIPNFNLDGRQSMPSLRISLSDLFISDLLNNDDLVLELFI